LSNRDFTCLLISSFTIDIFSGYMSSGQTAPNIECTVAPYNQIFQILADKNSEYWKEKPDFAVLWTQAEHVIPTFNHILEFKDVRIDALLHEVDEYSSRIKSAAHEVKALFVPTWVMTTYTRGLGMMDMKADAGVARNIMRMNLRLAENLDTSPNTFLLDTQKWIDSSTEAFIPKLWYMGKIAFGKDVFKEAAHDIKSAIRGLTGQTKKLILLDLDDTLWGGIVGDIGWENLTLGGHDYVGEAYADFQRALKALTNRGIILGIVSKNEESTALTALQKHPEMVLQPEDFAGWKINWKDKAQNISDLVSELHLGLQSVVFIDDNPFERARVRESLPEVYVPEWPEDATLYRSTLLSLRCFDTPSFSSEDRDRTKIYAAERHRNKLHKTVGSLEKWLNSLDIKVTVEELSNSNLQRTVQLLNKTNQMNLTTRRITEKELADWTADSKHKVWTFHVSDKFGDSGLVGIESLEIEETKGRVVDFVLSCRVMGRKIEETMLFFVVNYVKSLDLPEVYANYVPTLKNKPCLDFWRNSDFRYSKKENLFTFSTHRNYRLPEFIELVGEK